MRHTGPHGLSILRQVRQLRTAWLIEAGVVAWRPAFLAENLRADDRTVLTAASGGEAIDALGAARPDVVLLDVVLPELSGYDVCRRVRQGDSVNDPWDPELPIIMLSGQGGASV